MTRCQKLVRRVVNRQRQARHIIQTVALAQSLPRKQDGFRPGKERVIEVKKDGFRCVHQWTGRLVYCL